MWKQTCIIEFLFSFVKSIKDGVIDREGGMEWACKTGFEYEYESYQKTKTSYKSRKKQLKWKQKARI